jgi:hypothetical protein
LSSFGSMGAAGGWSLDGVADAGWSRAGDMALARGGAAERLAGWKAATGAGAVVARVPGPSTESMMASRLAIWLLASSSWD